MLRTRVLTAAVFAPLLIAAVLWLPPAAFSALIGVLFVVGAWEYGRLCGLAATLPRLIFTVLVAGALAAAAYWVFTFGQPVNWTAEWIILITLASVWLAGFARLGYFSTEAVSGRWRAVSLAFSFVFVLAVWYTLTRLRLQPDGQWWVLLLLISVWSADVGAYFAGRAFGRHKLAPRISPGKTWEGVFGGVLLSALVVLLAAYLMPIWPVGLLGLTVVVATTVISSVGGDLYISLHKRRVGLKDSGNLFPGHGGVLDRFDSLMSGSVFFALSKFLFGL